MEDNEILELLLKRREQALSELERKYGTRLKTLANRMVSEEDAKECVNDTYLAVWNSIPPNRPEYLFAYAAKICRNLALNKLERDKAAKRSAVVVELSAELMECVPGKVSATDETGLRELLVRFLGGLPEEWLEKCYETRLTSVTEETEEKNGTGAKPMRFGNFGKTAVKWAVAATAAILLCGGGVAYAAKLGVLQFTKSEDKDRQGFSLMTETERISKDELTGEIQEVEGFLRDYMAEEDYSQEFPSWLKQFETVEKARAYIGYADMKETKVPGTVEEVNVRVIGDTEGNLGEVSLFVRAEEGDISINETAAVFTEESPISVQGTGIRYSKEYFEVVQTAPDYRSKEYVTASGKNAVFVYEEYEEGAGGNRWLVGTVVDGAVYYELSLMYYPEDLERAKEIMYEWCEQF